MFLKPKLLCMQNRIVFDVVIQVLNFIHPVCSV